MKRHRFPLVLMLAALVLSFIGCQAPETQVTGTVNVTVDIQGYDGYDKVVIWGTDSSGNAGPGSITLESSEKSGTLTLPAGTWTVQASVMKGGDELASGKTSVKVIPDTTVSASITIKKNEGGGGESSDLLVPKFSWNGMFDLTYNSNMYIELTDMNSKYSYYMLLDDKKFELNGVFTYFKCSEFGYGEHSVKIGVVIDGQNHETEAMTLNIVEGVNVDFVARTPDGINTAVATISMKPDNPHKDKSLTYKWHFATSPETITTEVPEVEVPVGYIDEFCMPYDVEVYDGSVLLFSETADYRIAVYGEDIPIVAKVPSTGSIEQTVTVVTPYMDTSKLTYNWKSSNPGLKITGHGVYASLSLSSSDIGNYGVGVRITNKSGEWIERWFILEVQADETVEPAGFDFTVKGLDDASYYKFALDEETPVLLEKLTFSRDVDPDIIHKAKIEAFDAHDRLIGSWSAENLEVKVGKRLAVDAVVTPLDVFGKVTLNITNSIDPIDGDPWLTPVSYKIHVKSVNDDFENTVTDISKPVVVDKLYENEAYIITVSAINSSDAIIGESTTVSAQAGEAEKNVNVEELKTNGTLDVSVGGVGSAATVNVSYGSINVPMKFTDGSWTGSLDTAPGKGSVTVSVNGIEKTIATRIVSGHPSKVSVSYTSVDLTIKNEIVTTPEIKITVVKGFDTATRQIVLKAEVAGYPDAAFTWQTTYGESFEGSEITWTVPKWSMTYYNINVITNCGGRNATKSYKLEIPTV